MGDRKEGKPRSRRRYRVKPGAGSHVVRLEKI
jgi:hypothetical protein